MINAMVTGKIRTLLLITLISICFGCSEYVPKQHSSISIERYELFVDRLLKAYKEKDDYSVAFELANLKAPNKLIFNHLENAVNDNIDCCNSIFYMNNLAGQGFFQNLYKADTIQFREVFNLCLQRLGKDAYDKYHEQYLKETEEYINSRPKLDSSLMNHQLIAELEKIRTNDQVNRKKLADIKIVEADKHHLRKIQLKLDSINLFKVDSILMNHGYPKVEEVGYDLNNTIFLVIHHQVNVPVREKYFSIFKDYLPKGRKILFNKRTQLLIQNNK